MKNKIILSDCDGVLTNWSETFVQWAVDDKNLVLIENHAERYWVEDKFVGLNHEEAHKYVHEFNRTDAIRTMPPLRDAVRYVGQLAELGYQFHVITAIEAADEIRERRVENLTNLFGEVFSEITLVGKWENKAKCLERYKDTHCWWLEDNVGYAETGHHLGLETILMSHDYNAYFEHDDIHVVEDWEQIYDLIASD